MTSCGRGCSGSARQAGRHPRHGGGAAAGGGVRRGAAVYGGIRRGRSRQIEDVVARRQRCGGGCATSWPRSTLRKAQPMPVDIGELRARYDRPMPSVADYDTSAHGPAAPAKKTKGGGVMSDLQAQAIRQHCKALRMPATACNSFGCLADGTAAGNSNRSRHLEALLGGRDGGAPPTAVRAGSRTPGCRD